MTTAPVPDFAPDDLPGRELHRRLAELRERSPVGEVSLAGQPSWLIAGHEALTLAFRDEAAFPAGEWYRRVIEPTQGRTFESMEGAEHLLYRRLATPAFRSRSVDRMEASGIEALAHELLDVLPGAGDLDLMEAFVARFPFLMISRVLGIPTERETEFVGWALGILRFDPKAARQFTEYLRPVLAERRRHPGEDVLSELLQAEVHGQKLGEEEVLSHIRLLFSAGGTTTHDALGNLLHTLLTHPEELDAIRRSPDRMALACEELLRWEPPVAVLPRLCLTGTNLCGVSIPPESSVLFAIAAANRDPAVFPDPDLFDPDRRTKDKLTFGLGSHSCPGLHMARANIRIAAQAILDRYSVLELSDEEAARPRGTTLRGPRTLPVRVQR
jgi:cytochrome P450